MGGFVLFILLMIYIGMDTIIQGLGRIVEFFAGKWKGKRD